MEELHAQGLLDVLKLVDKELVEKVLALVKIVNVEHLENGVVRVSVDIVPKS